jgi:hypothetical protein
MYGTELPRDEYERQYDRRRSVIGAVERTPRGNTLLRVGREIRPEGPWEQTEPVVLTPEEAARLAAELAPAATPPAAPIEPDPCTCNDLHGCGHCFDEAEKLIGKQVRDSNGREWIVRSVEAHDGFPSVNGSTYWAMVEDVTVIDAKGQAIEP